jgi:hypothetical protein
VADIEVRWGEAGTQPVVFDVTHRLPVPFSTHLRATFGFLTDANATAGLEYTDAWHIPGLEGTANIGGNAANDPEPLDSVPTLQPTDVTGDRAADGNGFGMYLAGELFFFQTDAIPTNTTWTLRTHEGVVTREAGSYVHYESTNEPDSVDLFRTPAVPGLRFAVQVHSAQSYFAELVDLSRIRVVPDPYYGSSRFDYSALLPQVRFMNLPPRATIRIYSTSGVLVRVLEHDGLGGESLVTWDLRNRADMWVANGVYFYHVTTPEGQEHIGRMTVIDAGAQP